MKTLFILILITALSINCFSEETGRAIDSIPYLREDNSNFMSRTGSYFVLGPRFSFKGIEFDFEKAEALFKLSSQQAFNYFNESKGWFKAYKRTLIVGGILFLGGTVTMVILGSNQKKTSSPYPSDSFEMSSGFLFTLICNYTIMFVSMIAAGVQMHMAMRYADLAVNAYNNGRSASFNKDFRFDRFIPAGQNPIKSNGINLVIPVITLQF